MIAGRYTLDAEIGRGGMGVVWRGTDTLLDREVALKRVGWVPGAQTADVTRAAREARLAASLNHAHVVAVFDFVAHQGEQWLVMEYVESRNLAQLVQERGPLPLHEAASLLSQAADALAGAHRAGIVHRDVKPSNILVTGTGQVKLTDFGIARAAGDTTLTQTGMVTGSPAYLAPEVATGSSATPASDVWSLGATLFHALTGHPPYDVRASVVTALYRIVHEEPPRPAEAGSLLPLLELTMARDPERRLPMTVVRDRLRVAALSDERATALVTAAPSPTAVLPVSGTGADHLHSAEPRSAGARPPASDRTPTVRTAPIPRPAAEAPRPAAQESLVLPDRPVRSRRPLRRVAGVGAAAVLALSGLVFGARALVGDTAAEASAASGSQAASSSAPESPADRTADSAPDAAALTGFAKDYLATVTTDPAAAWQRLTPAFRAASGGYRSYAGFWGGIASAEVLNASADPANLTVTYTVRYHRTSGRQLTDRVTLQLEQAGDALRIAGER